MAPSILGNSSIILADAIIEDKNVEYEKTKASSSKEFPRKPRQVKKKNSNEKKVVANKLYFSTIL